MEILLFAVIIAQIAERAWMQHRAEQKEQDMLNRLMSKDLEEYKDFIVEPVQYDPVIKTDEDEYWQEIEERKV